MSAQPKGFIASVKNVFWNTFNLAGRTSRGEFWKFYLFILIGSFLCTGLDFLLFMRLDPNPFFFRTVFLTVILIPLITAGIRRLHDINMTGWWMVTALFPIIGFFIIHYFFLFSGTIGPNKFGPDPLGRIPPQKKRKKKRRVKKPDEAPAKTTEQPPKTET